MVRSRMIALFSALILALPALAAEPTEKGPQRAILGVPLQLAQAKEEKKDEKKKDEPPATDLFAEAPAERAESSTGLYPNMLGDQGPNFGFIDVPVRGSARLILADGQFQIVRFNGTRRVRIPIPGRTGIKIAENASVMPVDGASFSYNGYYEVQPPDDGSTATARFRTQVPSPFSPPTDPVLVPAVVVLPGVAPQRVDLHRETFALEKTFFDGQMSLGMRLPFYQQVGNTEDRDIGDMTFVVKVAPWIDPMSGSGASLGLAITAPTGPDIPFGDGTIHPTIIQPFVGYIFGGDRFFIHGFTSVGIPSDDRDVTHLFNDVGVGYWVYRGSGGIINGVAPTIEAHVTTPLDHRGESDVIRGLDVVVLTGGVHLGVFERSLLTLGVAVPVSGPRPFDVEAIVHFNLRF
jgi:hypothetical protein